jgi:nicotinamide mononucleotide transporter
MDAFEIVGTLLGLLSVWLTIRQSLWCWPTGIVSVSAYAVLFFRIRLYADAGLQIFFVATSLYGWYAWRFGGEDRRGLRVRVLSPAQRAGLAGVLAPAVALVAWALAAWTDASLPWWDTLAALLSIAAQLLLMRKILENWLCWIAVDVLSIALYLVKGVYLTAGLYAIFLMLAVMGLREWTAHRRRERA